MQLADWLAAFRDRDLRTSLREAVAFVDAARTIDVIAAIFAGDGGGTPRGPDLGLELDHVGFLGTPGAGAELSEAARSEACDEPRSHRSRVQVREFGVPTRVFRIARGTRAVEVFVPESTPESCPAPAHVALVAPAQRLDAARRALLDAGFRVPAAYPEHFVTDGDGSSMMYFDRLSLRVEVFARGVL